MPEKQAKHAYYIKTENNEVMIVVVEGKDILKAVEIANMNLVGGEYIADVEHLGVAVVAE